MIGPPRNFAAVNTHLASLHREIKRLDNEIADIKRRSMPLENEESDTGKLRRRYRLHEKIVEHFNMDELQSLMYSVGVVPENIAPMEPLNERCMEFVLYMQRHNKMDLLKTRLIDLRPLVDWNI